MQEPIEQMEQPEEMLNDIPQEVMDQLSRIPHLLKTIELLEGEVSMHRVDKARMLVQLEHASFEIQELEARLHETPQKAPESQPTE